MIVEHGHALTIPVQWFILLDLTECVYLCLALDECDDKFSCQNAAEQMSPQNIYSKKLMTAKYKFLGSIIMSQNMEQEACISVKPADHSYNDEN